MEEPREAGADAGPETLVCPECDTTSFHVTRRDERSLHLECTSCDAPPLSLEPTLRIWDPQDAPDAAEAAEAPASPTASEADGDAVLLKQVDDREPDPVVMAELRAWRIAESNRRNLPRYRVLPNRTIEALAKHAPRDLEELGEVWGIGPTRLDKYGAKILEILHGTQRGDGPQLAEA